MKKIKFSNENIISFSLSIILAINSFLFISVKTGSGYAPHSYGPRLYYLVYLIIIIGILFTLRKYSERFNWKNYLVKIILITLPAEIIFLNAFRSINPHYTPLHWSFHFLASLWLFITAFLILNKLERKLNIGFSFLKNRINFKDWIKKQGSFYLIILALAIGINFTFGFYNIQKASIVDEALWTFKRIPNFWKNIGEQDWYGARVSDKPGLTTAVVSGFGLLKIEDPKKYDSKDISPEKIESLNFAFRFPILIFATLMLPLLYFFTERLLGKKIAIFSTIFIGLSPILIGMTRMINPDAFLWIFTTLSLMTFLTFLEKKKDSAIFWSGIFLGLSLLTKYVSNFLYIFFLGLIFLKYIFSESAKKNSNLFFRKNLFSYIILVFISLLVFFLAYPGTWIKPDRIILGTAMSQAFEPIFPYFALILIATLVDTFLLKNIILKNVLNFISTHRKKLVWIISGIFLIFLGIIFWNAYNKNSLFELASILSSPKSSYRDTVSLWFMATNFYPLIFGVSPIASLLVIYFLIKNFYKKTQYTLNFRISFYLIIFILLYYAGSVFSHVSSTIRYQIILYPLIFIVAGISLGVISKRFENKKYWTEALVILIIIVLSSILFSIRPFYFSYTSKLLPKAYHIDYKDMGVGSYEAAAYLNDLSGAKDMTIWSDKKGVCLFFIGKCNSKFDEDDMSIDYDYYVISSGRKSLTNRKIEFELTHGHPDTPRIDLLYSQSDAKKTINLANRPSNYIKIFEGGILKK